LPTPIDPAAPRRVLVEDEFEDLPLFFGHRLRKLNTEAAADASYDASAPVDPAAPKVDKATLDEESTNSTSTSEFGDVIYPAPFLDPTFV
jgi:hypothetical protein